jgi:hypothetical protein
MSDGFWLGDQKSMSSLVVTSFTVIYRRTVLLMPANDHPIVALDKQLDLEDLSTSSIAKLLLRILS